MGSIGLPTAKESRQQWVQHISTCWYDNEADDQRDEWNQKARAVKAHRSAVLLLLSVSRHTALPRRSSRLTTTRTIDNGQEALGCEACANAQHSGKTDGYFITVRVESC